MSMFRRRLMMQALLKDAGAPTPDCYYDFTNGDNTSETRDTIKDYSGNGNDAVAHNFAWNEESSGYKDGALYFDGVDDYISLDAFPNQGFRTVFILAKLLNYNIMPYESRKLDGNGHFLIHTANMLPKGNIAGDLYINNNLVKIKSLSAQDNGKKILLHVIDPTALDSDYRTPTINKWLGSVSPKVGIYKFLGFKEALTEEQIQYVIKKYNLLDGVDEIEVS